MAVKTTYAQARASLGRLCDAATKDRKTIIIRRDDGEDVALIAASELRSLEETVHLLRSPRNAERLLRAMFRVLNRPASPDA